MNEFERRLLDTVEFTSYIGSFADPSRRVLGIETYAYCVDDNAASIDETAASEYELIMDSDSDFVVCYLSGAGKIVAGPTVANGTRCTEYSPGILVQIFDQASGKTWFNIPTPISLMAGAGGFPYILTSPRIVKPRSTLTVSAQGAASGADYNGFYFAMHGAKIFYA